jgi:hypothetical protein
VVANYHHGDSNFDLFGGCNALGAIQTEGRYIMKAITRMAVLAVLAAVLGTGCEIPGIDDDSKDMPDEIRADNGSVVVVNSGPGSASQSTDNSQETKP